MKSKPLRMKPSDLARISTELYDPVQLLESLEDRKEEQRPDLQGSFVPPRNPVEELVAGIWSQVLGVESVGASDRFFDLGGHSLLATQVLSRLRDAFKVNLSLRSFFHQPTVAGLAEAVESARRGSSGPEVPPLRPVSRQGRIPLSFAQQRLWFLHQLEPESAAYNVPTALRMEGSLDVPAFRAALGEVVRRHEALRTTFTETGGEPAQVITAAAPLRSLPVLDLSALPAELRETELRLLVRAQALRLFDLAHGPLLRVTLAALGPEEHVVLLTIHHIVTDGWSMDVLVREMAELYESFSAGRPSPLRELPVQYADFSVWQRGWLSGQVLDDEVAHWREQLNGLPPVLDLPLDRPRPAVQTYAGAGRPLLLPGDLVKKVRKLAHRQGATLFMALLAAFNALLSRYSSQEDLAVGTPVAGRHHLETEKQIGFFANTLVLRADLAGEPGMRDLIARARDAVLEALSHQELPFEKLVEELQPKRDLSYTPLFQVMFELQNRPLEALQVRGISFRPLRMERDTAQFDLTMSLLEGERDIAGMLTFNRGLFEATTIERLAGHFLTLLDGLATEPDRRFTELPLWTGAERHQILLEHNDTAQMPGQDGLSALFAAQVRRSPDAVAAAAGEERLTYAALAARVRHLARSLARLGVGPEVRVALLAERGLPLLTTILAVLEAGGAYLPLDPGHPAERQARLTAQSGVAFVLAQSGLAPALPRPVLDLESLLDPEDLDAEDPAADLPATAQPGNLAYVIYTSGSTGVPKGAMVEHRGMMNHLRAKIADLGLTAADTVAQTASQCFDISVWQLLAPLLAGGSMHIAGDEIAHDPERLLAFAGGEGITVLETVPSMLRAMLDATGSSAPCLPALRWLIVTGEALPAELAQRWLAGFPAAPLLNAYGPTECSDDVTHHVIRRPPEPGSELPIGRSLINFHLYLLDRHQVPVPLGLAGELCIAGLGVGRGYLNDPSRTAEVFVPDALGALRGERGGRLYKTGDLARLRPDGTFQFLGRLDTQVKVRGFRVELGEIETALRSQPGVGEAVVLSRTDPAGPADSDRSEGARLVAYVVPGEPVPGTGSLDEGDLREGLRRRLPEYMVPSAFVFLDAMPLTPNGKLDRRALPDPGPSETAAALAPSARTPIEEMVIGVWSEVLGHPRVGAHESFFDLGGHSLLAIQVISRVRALLGVEVPLRAIFEKPTPALFAESVLEALRAGAGMAAPPLVPVPRGRALPASFAQQRLWFLHQLEPASVAYNLPAAVRLEGALDRGALRAALTEIVRRHESLRTRFGVLDGAPVQIIDGAGPIDLPVVDLRALPAAAAEGQARLLVRGEGRRPFDLAHGPLLRTGLIALGAEEHVLSLNMHHVVGDAWSTAVLVRELRALYEAFSQRRPSPLPELEIQYADFAAWQRQWLSGDVLEEEIRYWRTRLGSSPPVLELPTDRPRPAVQTFRGTNCWFSLPAALSGRLQALSRKEGTTLFMTLLSAFYALLARYSGQSDLVVGTPIAGRNHLQTENLIGFFVNTLVLRADLGGDPELAALALQVKELTLSSYAHQDLPFEKLVNELHPQRDLSRTPLFQVMFALQNVPAEALESPGLKLRPLAAGSGMAKFDLTAIFFGGGGGDLTGTFEYNLDLFEAATMRRMAGHFQVLLESFAGDPLRRVSALALLTEAERAQALLEWNDCAKECPQAPMVHELFAGFARRRPWATAVASPHGQLTYGELEARANRLAHHLRSLGVGPEVLVALCTNRTLERVVGIVAVLKAGGAYVSLDPTYPRERLAFLLEDAGAPVLLTERRFVDLLPATGSKVICLDAGWDLVQGDESRAPESGVGPESLAYVVYTSGSTGKPKGVEIPHAGLMNLVRWHQDLYGVKPEDRGTQIASPAFDASIWELWPYLAGGASVHIPDEETRLSSPGMVRWWSETGITLAYLMTPLAEGVLEVDIPPDLDLRVRALIIGGDRLHRRPDPAVGFRLMNHYGPAEYTVTSTVVRVPPQGEGGSLPAIPTIGRPIDNTRIYILDRGLSPVPVGVHGELFVAGTGLARGYLGRPELTAEKFLPDPFAEEPGARMYRTADLVRHLPDGDIDFLGRLDHQVKLRGLRIELGEIETVLGQHPGLREAVVLVREDRPGAKRLAAYVVPSPGQEPSVEEMRDYLRERLPEYMIPSAFLQLDALPLTENGKVDRRALPAPERDLESTYVAPRDPVEERLAELWSSVLGIERVGVHDDFFELGGHSLLATQLVARIREALGVEVPLRGLFQAPTVASFAEVVLERQLGSQAEDDLAELLAELEGLSEEEIAAQLAAGEVVNAGEGLR